jgi:hypothetical protein
MKRDYVKKEFVLKVSFEVEEDNEYDDESYVNDLKAITWQGIEDQKYPVPDPPSLAGVRYLEIVPLVKGGNIGAGYWASPSEPQDRGALLGMRPIDESKVESRPDGTIVQVAEEDWYKKHEGQVKLVDEG